MASLLFSDMCRFYAIFSCSRIEVEHIVSPTMEDTGQQPTKLVNHANNSDDDISIVLKPLPAEQFYVSQAHSLKALIILYEGMKDESSASLVDYSLLPWCSMQKSGRMNPTVMT